MTLTSANRGICCRLFPSLMILPVGEDQLDGCVRELLVGVGVLRGFGEGVAKTAGHVRFQVL